MRVHHFCGSWHTGARRHPSRMACPRWIERVTRTTDDREDGPSNVPKAQCEGEVHAACFSIHDTMGRPHLALSMSSFMYSHLSLACGRTPGSGGCGHPPLSKPDWSERPSHSSGRPQQSRRAERPSPAKSARRAAVLAKVGAQSGRPPNSR